VGDICAYSLHQPKIIYQHVLPGKDEQFPKENSIHKGKQTNV